MSQIAMTDPTIAPTDELVLAYLGENITLWNALKEHLYANHEDISEIWRYYNDGKCWLFRYQIRKKTICWLSILEDRFQIGFWFGEKAEPVIEASNVSERAKSIYRNAKRTKIGRGIGFVVLNQEDVTDAIRLMEVRIKVK